MATPQTPDSLEMAEIAQSRSLLYSLVILPFAALPDPGFAETVMNEEFISVLDHLAQEAETPEDIRAGSRLMLEDLRSWSITDIARLSETLGVERTRLYRGVAPGYGPPPPLEAVWTTRKGPVPVILQNLAEFYQHSGLALAADLNERPDNISVELEFQRQLVLREAESWRQQNPEKAGEQIRLQFAFLTGHLLQWTPRFIEEALAQAQTGFYQGHLRILRGLLADELAYLQPLAQ